jgi:transcriptional regulator with XRE-family HTH domain
VAGAKAYPAFGKALRRMRREAGLTLRRVAALSRRFTDDPSGRISDGYLSSLEHGRPARVSLSKLITLAAIYAVPLRQLVDAAPPPLHDRLDSELRAQTTGDRMTRPDTRGLYLAPRGQIDEHLHALIVTKADSVAIPINAEWRAREVIHDTIIRASCIPAYLDKVPVERTAFYRRWPEPFEALAARSIRRIDVLWHQAVDTLCSYLLYEKRLGEPIVGTLARWSIDFENEVASCSFTQADTNERFGYDGIPLVVVRAAGNAQIASFLAGGLTGVESPEPPLRTAVRKYLLRLTEPVDSIGDRALPDIAGAIAAAQDLSRQLPDLKPGPHSYDAAMHRAVLGFLTRFAGPRRRRSPP